VDQLDRAGSPRAGEEIATPAAERVRRIVAAAEAEAADIRFEAEAYATARRREADEEAERILAEARRSGDELVLERVRRISELSDTILDRGHRIAGAFESANQVKQRLERLVETLSEVAERVAIEASEAPEPPPPPGAGAPRPEPRPGGGEPPVRPAPPPEPPRPAASESSETQGARLVALQMALDGRTRGEIEGAVERQFEVADPAGIVDDVLGAARSRRLIARRRRVAE